MAGFESPAGTEFDEMGPNQSCESGIRSCLLGQPSETSPWSGEVARGWGFDSPLDRVRKQGAGREGTGHKPGTTLRPGNQHGEDGSICRDSPERRARGAGTPMRVTARPVPHQAPSKRYIRPGMRPVRVGHGARGALEQWHIAFGLPPCAPHHQETKSKREQK